MEKLFPAYEHPAADKLDHPALFGNQVLVVQMRMLLMILMIFRAYLSRLMLLRLALIVFEQLLAQIARWHEYLVRKYKV